MSGFFGIGIYHTKTEANVGTLWRSAYQLGASFIFTVGRRYKKQASDTTKTWRSIPLYHYHDMDTFLENIPYDCRIIAVEMGGGAMENMGHPDRCIYLLGAEDHGLPQSVLENCNMHISLAAVRQPSFNVAVAGSIVMYDRLRTRTLGNGEV